MSLSDIFVRYSAQYKLFLLLYLHVWTVSQLNISRNQLGELFPAGMFTSQLIYIPPNNSPHMRLCNTPSILTWLFCDPPSLHEFIYSVFMCSQICMHIFFSTLTSRHNIIELWSLNIGQERKLIPFIYDGKCCVVAMVLKDIPIEYIFKNGFSLPHH